MESLYCPRGNHGILAEESHPNTAYVCYICGHREYPGFVKRIGTESGTGARHFMSRSQKAAAASMIYNLVVEGCTNPEIEELTGYTKSRVEKDANKARKLIREAQ